MSQIGTKSGPGSGVAVKGDKADMTGRITKGAAWIVGGRFLMRIIGLVNTLIVARLLTPEDFGIVAISFIALQILQGMSDFGAAQAVVKFHDADRDDYDTIWTFSLLRGLLLAGVLIALAWPAAQLYDEPALVPLFLVMAIAPILEGLINPRFYEFERALDFKREFIVVGLNKFTAVAVSISLALIFRNYWALVGGLLVGGLVQLILSFWFLPFRPHFSFKSHKKIFGFAGWLTATGALVTLNLKFDSLIIARLFGMAPTGGYFLGMQLVQLPTNELATPVSRALFPGMSEQQDDEAAMRRTCLGGVAGMAAIAAPVAVGMGFVAPDLVPLFFGPGYELAIPVVQWVAPTLGLYFLSEPIRPFALARGKTKLLFIRELIYMVLRLPSFIIAALMFGFIGAIIARALAGLAQLGLNLLLYSRITGRSALEPLAHCWRSLLALAVMSVWFLLIHPNIPHLPDNLRLLRMLLDAAIGAGLYTITHLLAWHFVGRPDGVEQMILKRFSQLAPSK
jgi:lipopolysaccharide exporter